MGKKDVGHQSQRLLQDEQDLEQILSSVPATNPIPWIAILKIAGPIIARVAIRFILRRMGKTTSEENIRAAANAVRDIIGRYVPPAK